MTNTFIFSQLSTVYSLISDNDKYIYIFTIFNSILSHIFQWQIYLYFYNYQQYYHLYLTMTNIFIFFTTINSILSYICQ